MKKTLNSLKVLVPKPDKPWYQSIGVWIAILLTIGIFVAIYIFYLTEHGYGLLLPEWMKR